MRFLPKVSVFLFTISAAASLFSSRAIAFSTDFVPAEKANASSPSQIRGELPGGWVDDSSYRGATVGVSYSKKDASEDQPEIWRITVSEVTRGQAQVVRPGVSAKTDGSLHVKLRARSQTNSRLLLGLRQSPARIDLYQSNPEPGWVQESSHTQLPRWLAGQSLKLASEWADYEFSLQPVYSDPAAELVLALREPGQVEIAAIYWSPAPAVPPSSPEALLTAEQAAEEKRAAIQTALNSKTSLSELFDTTTIIGAQIDESQVQRTIRVDASNENADAASLTDGFLKAYDSLSQGVPTKLLIAAGIYREAAPDLDWALEPARSTLFIVEGEGDVQWTGADIFPLSTWKNEGNGLYSHPWQHAFAFENFAARSDSNRALVSQRSEMAFVNNRPLKQRILETYTTTGVGLRTPRDEKITHTYATYRDPKKTLKPGEFGVAEREENGKRIWFRAPVGEILNEQSIEVSVRRNLVRFVDKQNLILRNLTAMRTANLPNRRAIHFAALGGPLSNNILIDNCRFLWNSNSGFQMAGEKWTMRNSEASYNGKSGITTFGLNNAIWIDNTTNFNNWRGHWGGETGYATAGVKLHQTDNHLVLGHTSLGNADHGFWYDIDCKNIYMQDVILVDNLNHGALHWELSAGPLHGRRLLLANADRSFFIFNSGQSLLEDSIISTAGIHSLPNFEHIFRFGGNDRTDAHAILSKAAFFKPRVEVRNTVLAVQPPFARGVVEWLDLRDPEKETFHPYTYSGYGNTFWGPESREPVTINIKKGVATNDGTNQIEPGGATLSLQEWSQKFEKEARLNNPGLASPSSYDFRLTKRSPLAEKSASYPQVVLSPSQIVELREFIYGDWLTYDEPAYSTTRPSTQEKP